MYNEKIVNILFIHYELPGQFLHLIRYLSKHPNYHVYGICHQHVYKSNDLDLYEKLFVYDEGSCSEFSAHYYIENLQSCILRAKAIAEILHKCCVDGINFDLAVSHIGWGEALYFKDIYPKTPLLGYVEFYYHAVGADAGFDPNSPMSKDQCLLIKTLNSQLLLGMNECDAMISPTNWQKSLFPCAFHPYIDVIHEGVDVSICKPDNNAFFTLPNGVELTKENEVITYTARNLEPYRGFHIFLKAIEKICQQRPHCHVIITGGDEVSYSKKPPNGMCYRELYLQSVSIPNDRVHFLGKVPYSTHIQLLQLSSIHIYLTYPFVLSWSFIEAMACGCVIIASDTQPVMDVLEPDINGIAVNFFDDEAIAEQVSAILNDPQRKKHLGMAARKKIEQYFQHHFSINHYLAIFQRLTTKEEHA